MNSELLASTIQSFGLPAFIVEFFATHPYEIIFLSLLVGGGIILFPAFYLAVLGVLNWWNILGVMVLATLLTDSFWYLIGRGALPKFIEARIEKGKYLKKITAVTEGRELTFLFYSKFIYGTRIAIQVLCGTRKVNFLLYILINTVTVTFLGVFYYGIIRFTAAGVDSLGDLRFKLGIILSVTMLCVGGLHYILYRAFRSKLLA